MLQFIDKKFTTFKSYGLCRKFTTFKSSQKVKAVNLY